MPRYDYDLFVIGAGSGGVRAARMSAAFGARVAIAEERHLGGTCVNVGCVPKKLLVYAARFSDEFEDAEGYGWSMDGARFDWRRLIRKKNGEIERLNGVYRKLLTNAGVTLLEGRATLEDEQTVRVNGQNYTAQRVLIATGGQPTIPDFPGNEHMISSNDGFFLDKLPDRALIVGGGYIAAEFAGIFNGLGVDTTLLYRGPLFLRGFDEEARRHLAGEMEQKGIALRFGTNLKRIAKADGELRATLTDGGVLSSGLILAATGRAPNASGLGLEQVGVGLDHNGAIIVDKHYRSNVPSIYALGDVTHRLNLTPVALAEGMAVAKTLYGGRPTRVDYTGIPSCVFSQPNLATVGLTEEEARQQYSEITVYVSRFTPMKQTLTGSGEKTFMKLLVDTASDRVIGANMVGEEAGEIIQGIAIAMKAGATKAQFDATIGIHPTAAEEFVTMREPR
jgi:glutathione reductase (NADPH)